ncbi:MAG: menaquinone biosynthesis protein [Planctomycetes bacterium]|nr:menaquinone biosynthesis protein [Planctomycetota bacterium]
MLRVAAVSYFNARPLLGDLRERAGFRVEEMPPAEVARALAAGRVDLGLVPVAAMLDDPRLDFLPGLCIGARGEVDSVFLWLRSGLDLSAPERAIRVGLDPHSRSSRLLARLWFEDFRGLESRRLELVEASPRDLLDDAARRADLDAFLVIGDLAMLREPGPGWDKVDLAQAWFEETGLPFVFAVWGIDRDLLRARPDLPAVFEELLEQGLARIDDYVAGEARARGIEPERARRYLNERIVYRMDEDARRGLETFLERARRLETGPGRSARMAGPAGD